MPVRSSRIAGALVALTAFLLVFGSTVRVHGAGLACPDWPLCFGQVVPAYEFGVYLEFGHRVVAGFVSLGLVGLTWLIARRGAFAAAPALRWLVPAAFAVLAVQVVLGGLTVLELLAEWTVASHLLAGNTFCALLLLIARALAASEAPASRAAVGPWARAVAVLLAVLLPAQLVLGGFVAGSHAGLACGTWPSCNGAGWFPTLTGPVGLQVVHRIVAYTLAAVVLVNAAAHAGNPRTSRPAWALVALVSLQIAVGVANVLLQLPAEVTLLHSAGAAALMLTTAWLHDEVWRSPAPAPAAALVAGAVEAK